MNNLSNTAINFLKTIEENYKGITRNSTETNWLLKPLKHLSRPAGMTLGMYYVGDHWGGNTEIYLHKKGSKDPYKFGDPYTTDKVIIYFEEDEEAHRIKRQVNEPLPVLNYLHIDKNPEAIWEAYLLSRVTAFLPKFWHAGYSTFHYIFSKEDLVKVHDFTDEELESILQKCGSFDPKVEYKQYNGVQEEHWLISFYKWSEWGGLTLNIVKATLGRGGSINFSDESTISIFKYNCRIMF